MWNIIDDIYFLDIIFYSPQFIVQKLYLKISNIILNVFVIENLNGTDLIALFNNTLSAAGEAELVSKVAGTLDKVGVLQLPRAIGALEDLSAVVAVTVCVPVSVAGA